MRKYRLKGRAFLRGTTAKNNNGGAYDCTGDSYELNEVAVLGIVNDEIKHREYYKDYPIVKYEKGK